MLCVVRCEMCKVRGLKRSKVGSGEGEDLYVFQACALTPYDHLIGEEKRRVKYLYWKTNPHYRSPINQQ